MCGFVGEVTVREPVTRPRLYRMANTLVHRGPDESHVFVDPNGKWGLGHRRLCVLDIEGGRQPMSHPDKPLTLVFNGEIYEHERLRCELSQQGCQFHTRSDTEVLLALYATYGLDFFPYLRGEFAFAIVDEMRRKLILVRDRIGLKPLFYTVVDGHFLFSSEIKALFSREDVRRELDASALLGAIVVADTPGQTVFKGIKQVRHAHYLEVDLDTLAMKEHRYWDAWANRRLDVPECFDEQTSLVRETVTQATRIRLRADVPVGAYLSGGLDSSLVTCTIAPELQEVDAFALSFDDAPGHDEFHYAKQVADHLPNVRLHRIGVSHSETIRLLPETVWHLEKPFGNLHSVAKLMASRYARDYVVAVLTGDGGDEAFCGYTTFWLQNMLQSCDYSLPAIRKHLRSMQKEASAIGSNRYYLAGGLAKKVGPVAKMLSDRLGFPPCDLATASDGEHWLAKLLHPDFRATIDCYPVERAADYLSTMIPRDPDIPHATLLQYVQLNLTVPEYIAVIADRTEWAGSVEARPPLFDHKVLELAMGLPLSAKLHGDREKHILREAFRDRIPSVIFERRKQAFLAPASPFRCPDGEALLSRFVSPQAVREAGIWNERAVQGVRLASRLFPRNETVNLLLTIIATTQILHAQFIKRMPR